MNASPAFVCAALQSLKDPTKYRCQHGTPLPMLYTSKGRANAAMKATKGFDMAKHYKAVTVHVTLVEEDD